VIRAATATLIGAAALAAAVPAVAAAPAPKVTVMVVGPKGAVLKRPAVVSTRAARITASGHRCTAPRGTALAALAGARRAGGPAFHVKDDGACGALYVDKIGKARAHGRSGWQYKVGTKAGTAGAGDPAGPFGTGRRIRSGSMVVWYWCSLTGPGCGRTLVVTPAAKSVAAAGSLRVRVRAYDDRGHGVAVKGARVSLGSDVATTGADGRAVLVAPARKGRATLRATKPGLIVAFPVKVSVR
jgi:hypothetical protein